MFYVSISILLRIIITYERNSFSGYVADCVSRSRKLQSIKLQNYTSKDFETIRIIIWVGDTQAGGLRIR